MSPEAQRIAIAMSLGWDEESARRGFKTITIEQDGYTYSQISTKLPDYLNDLNAIHEALITLPDNDHFTAHLDQFIYEDNRRLVSKMDRVKATVKQLAKAYLVTIGKWEGGSDEPQG